MVANAALKNDLSAPSFSLGFSQSSEEATLTQEGEPPANMKKSQDNLILVEELEELEELVEVINTRVAATLNYAKQKSPSPEKVQPTLSFLNKFKTPMRQKEITNDLKKKEFHWNAALASHQGKFIHPKTNKPFQIKDYQDYIPYLPQFAMCSIGGYGWWMLKRRNFMSLTHQTKNFLQKTTEINKFVGFIISQMRVFFGEKPLINNDESVEAPYVNISGQRTTYQTFLFNKFYCDFEQVDHFRVEYASLILFDKMNQLKDKAIQESETIRLSKSFVALLSSYNTFESADIDMCRRGWQGNVHLAGIAPSKPLGNSSFSSTTPLPL
ncbi:hypothetical protein Ahy_B06g081978 [Arachis hypogaea]|uniref:Uncharacterized protein n=1 Tax=Arachis hypogaea TaxID=3818 RepID=A0A444YMQ8_ARAHY|nr:hypothetical protein Ahy_B06g081978 [Arachis hypogaea]